MLRKVLLVLSFFIISGCNKINSPVEQLTVTSATQFLPLVEAFAGAYREETGKIIVVKGSFGQEAEMLSKGFSDFIVTSDELPNNLPHKVLAFDQTIVIVNPANKIERISLANLRKIFSGEVTVWEQIDGSGGQIQILGREAASPIRRAFEKYFLQKEGSSDAFSLRALIFNSNPDLRAAVSTVRGGIGYISKGSLNSSVKELKVVEEPTHKEFEAPLINVTLAWSSGNLNNEQQSFYKFLTESPRAKAIVQELGFAIEEQ